MECRDKRHRGEEPPSRSFEERHPSLTGKIQFYVNGRIAGSAMPLLPDGTATLALPQLPACVRAITAMYSGDNYYGSSVSAELSVGQ